MRDVGDYFGESFACYFGPVSCAGGDAGGGERRAKGGTGGRGEGRERQTQRGQTTVSVALMGDAGGSKGEEIDRRGAWVGGVGGERVYEEMAEITSTVTLTLQKVKKG